MWSPEPTQINGAVPKSHKSRNQNFIFMKNLKQYLAAVVLLFFCLQVSLAQNEDLTSIRENQQKIENSNAKLNAELKLLKSELISTKNIIESMKIQIEANAQLFQTACEEFDAKVLVIESNSNTKISTLDKALSSGRIFWILAIIITALISIILFFWLLKKLMTEKLELLEAIAIAKSTIETKDLELETKINQIINSQKKSTKVKPE